MTPLADVVRRLATGGVSAVEVATDYLNRLDKAQALTGCVADAALDRPRAVGGVLLAKTASRS